MATHDGTNSNGSGSTQVEETRPTWLTEWLSKDVLTVPPINLYTIALLRNPNKALKMKSLVIYHGNCADGFGAAYAAWKHFGDTAEYHAGVYDEILPDCTGRDVYFLDFSAKRDTLEKIIAVANRVTILDHHKSAVDDLQPLLTLALMDGVLDVTRSGAMIAWEWFHPNQRAPRLIHYIQDRDLWQFKLPYTRQVAAALFSYAYDFKVWDGLMNLGALQRLIDEGIPIERKHWKDIEEFSANAVRMNIAGFNVLAINCPYQWSSDMANMLSMNEPFAACYWDTPTGRVWSLRSHKNGGEDVAKIAEQFGGGGHKHASGFRTPLTPIKIKTKGSRAA